MFTQPVICLKTSEQQLTTMSNRIIKSPQMQSPMICLEVAVAVAGDRTAGEGRKEELDALREIIDIAHETGEEINDTSDQDDQLKGALTFYLPPQTVTFEQ